MVEEKVKKISEEQDISIEKVRAVHEENIEYIKKNILQNPDSEISLNQIQKFLYIYDFQKEIRNLDEGENIWKNLVENLGVSQKHSKSLIPGLVFLISRKVYAMNVRREIADIFSVSETTVKTQKRKLQNKQEKEINVELSPRAKKRQEKYNDEKEYNKKLELHQKLEKKENK